MEDRKRKKGMQKQSKPKGPLLNCDRCTLLVHWVEKKRCLRCEEGSQIMIDDADAAEYQKQFRLPKNGS